MRGVYEQWRSFSNEYLATKDVAYGNLRSGVDLPGYRFEEREIPALQEKLNHWAAAVRAETDLLRPGYERNRSRYDGTVGQFRMHVLVTVLQRDLGVRYNQKFMEGEYDGTDPRNMFLYGVLTGFGGTCVTLPLLYIAIGRRLGYPLFLVAAQEHYFVRWEGQGERFNIEATTLGFSVRVDEYYLTWPKPLSAAELKTGSYLRNYTPREELASSWLSRGTCFFEHLMLDDAVEAFHHAGEMAPELSGKGMTAHALAAREVLRIMESLPATLSVEEQLQRADPPVSQPWHASAVAQAKENLLRIHRNRRKAAGEAPRRGEPNVVKPLRNVRTRTFSASPAFRHDRNDVLCACDRGLVPTPCNGPNCPFRPRASRTDAASMLPRASVPAYRSNTQVEKETP